MIVGSGGNSRAEFRKLLFSHGKEAATISVTSVLTKGIAGLISINSGVTVLFIASSSPRLTIFSLFVINNV